MCPIRSLSSPLRGFLRGLACPFRAFPLILRSRRMLLLGLLPFVLCLLIYVGFFVAVLLLTDDVVGLIVEPGAWWRTVLRVALLVALPVAFLVFSVFTYTAFCFVVAGPLYEWLSAGAERAVTGSVEEEPFSVRGMLVDLGRALMLAVAVLSIELFVLVLSILLVPVTTVLGVMASAVLLAVEYLDYPMGRRRMGLRQRVRFARRHVWELLGLGLPLLFCLMVPFVGALFLPVGVVGGTLLFVELQGRPEQPERR
jgi:CysZ protein